jgi:type IV pilus assembly protein PilF
MRSRSSQFRAAVLAPLTLPSASLRSGSRGRGISPRPTRLRLAALVAFSAFVGLASVTGCTGKGSQNPNAQSTERQSDAEYDLARDLFEKGNPRAALDHAMKAISLNEDNDKAQYFVAVVHLSFCNTNRGMNTPECHLEQVEKYARNALKAKPDFRDATNLLGQTLVNEKRCKEAITVLEPLTKDPAYVHPYFAWGNLGEAQLCDGQVDAAIVSLKNAVAEPRFCVGHHRLGLAYEKKGDLPNADASFTNAVSADPACEQLQDAWWGRCRIRSRLGNVEWKKDCQKCADISGETPTGKLCIATLGPSGGAPSDAGSPASATPHASSPNP